MVNKLIAYLILPSKHVNLNDTYFDGWTPEVVTTSN